MNKGSFGEILKRERELREVTLNEVTVATRIPPRFLEAFEREEWEKLPGGVFNRGFVRAIARYLGLDEENLLSEYDLAYGEQRAAMPALPTIRFRRRQNGSLPLRLIAILILFVGRDLGLRSTAGTGTRRIGARRNAPRATASATTADSYGSVMRRGIGRATNAPLPRSAISEPQGARRQTAARGRNACRRQPDNDSTSQFRLRCQTRVRVVADGRVVLDSRLPAGETRRLFAKNQFVVSAAHPEAVLLEMNGQAMPSLTSAGPSGTMVLSQKDLRQAPSGNAQR